jgi:hypothetical protein
MAHRSLSLVLQIRFCSFELNCKKKKKKKLFLFCRTAQMNNRTRLRILTYAFPAMVFSGVILIMKGLFLSLFSLCLASLLKLTFFFFSFSLFASVEQKRRERLRLLDEHAIVDDDERAPALTRDQEIAQMQQSIVDQHYCERSHGAHEQE